MVERSGIGKTNWSTMNPPEDELELEEPAEELEVAPGPGPPGDESELLAEE